MADIFRKIEQGCDDEYKALRGDFPVSRRCAKTRRAIKKINRKRTRARMKALEQKEQYAIWCEQEEEREELLQELLEAFDDFADWDDDELSCAAWEPKMDYDEPCDEDFYDYYDPWYDYVPEFH